MLFEGIKFHTQKTTNDDSYTNNKWIVIRTQMMKINTH